MSNKYQISLLRILASLIFIVSYNSVNSEVAFGLAIFGDYLITFAIC